MRLNGSLLATLLALPCSLIACGGDDGGNNNGGPDGGGGGNPPTGTHYGYVVNKAKVAPSTTPGNTANDYGLDLGTKTNLDLDGKVDNQLGNALGTLNGLFPVQVTVDTAINTGAIILLADLQTSAFTNAAAAGIQVKFGDKAKTTPPPCADAADTTCGGHLKGGATIGIAANSPTDAALTGKFVNGTFNSDPGNISLAIALGDAATPVNINLIHARVKAVSVSDTGMTANIGGIVTQAELKDNIAPAITASVATVLAEAGCDPKGNPTGTPACGCTKPSTTTDLILGDIDGADGTAKDCKVTPTELLAYPTAQILLKPDICSTASCTAPDALSIGVQVTAVKATIQ